MEDKMLIALFFERSEQAIRETRNKYGTVVRRTAFHILHDWQDTEECENDTYLAAWNNIPPAQPDPLAAYLCRIARNQALKRYHANSAQRRNSAYDLALDELEEVIAEKGGGPVAAWEVKELTQAIESFLDTLDPADRKLFVRRYWFAEPVKELAAQMRLSPHRVSVKLFRIRARLQKYLKKEGSLS